jgi:hypothetical protein
MHKESAPTSLHGIEVFSMKGDAWADDFQVLVAVVGQRLAGAKGHAEDGLVSSDLLQERFGFFPIWSELVTQHSDEGVKHHSQYRSTGFKSRIGCPSFSGEGRGHLRVRNVQDVGKPFRIESHPYFLPDLDDGEGTAPAQTIGAIALDFVVFSAQAIQVYVIKRDVVSPQKIF